jgi:ribonuclease P protein component
MYNFAKEERLHSKRNIQSLFEQGNSYFQYPFKVYYHFSPARESEVAASILFSVGKKSFKKAVDRNKIKRLCRESYRLNKNPLIQALKSKNKKVDLAFIYVGKSIPDFQELQTRLVKSLHQLQERLETKKD